MLQPIQKALRTHRALMLYGCISIIVTLLDIAVSYGAEYFLQATPVLANTAGVVSGFLLQYFLAAERVFHRSNRRTFLIFFVTFLLGLLLADGLVSAGRNYLFAGFSDAHAFLLSKGLSIIVPFFALYYARRYAISKWGKA